MKIIEYDELHLPDRHFWEKPLSRGPFHFNLLVILCTLYYINIAIY